MYIIKTINDNCLELCTLLFWLCYL